MADWYTPTEEQRAAWAEWVAERPERVRRVAETMAPWKLYRMKSTGHRVTILSITEPRDKGPITLMVDVSGTFNLVACERQVFGVPLDDIEECELPAEGEVLGTANLSIEEAKQWMGQIDEARRKSN